MAALQWVSTRRLCGATVKMKWAQPGEMQILSLPRTVTRVITFGPYARKKKPKNSSDEQSQSYITNWQQDTIMQLYELLFTEH